MNFTWDPIYTVNLILCIIIFIFGLIGNKRSKSIVSMNIGIAFGLFGLSHLATLLGLKPTLATILIVIRTIAYLIVVFTVYKLAFKSK